MSSSGSFQNRNLPDRVADHVVTLIAKGNLVPGQRLLEKAICEELGVSRIPVREALRLLQAQGVVRTEPNKGTFVMRFGPTEAAELLELRLSVERIALRRVLERRHGDGRTDIADAFAGRIDELRRSALLRDRLAYCQADLGFHSQLVELSHSPLLRPVWDSLSRGVLVLMMKEHDVDFDYAESIREHEILVELLRTENGVAADREIERHILRYMRHQDGPMSTRSVDMPSMNK